MTFHEVDIKISPAMEPAMKRTFCGEILDDNAILPIKGERRQKLILREELERKGSLRWDFRVASTDPIPTRMNRDTNILHHGIESSVNCTTA